MNKLSRYLILAAATIIPVSAQVDPDLAEKASTYMASCTWTMAAATADCALTLPSTSSKNLYLDRIVVRSPEAASVTFERGGTAGSTNAVTTIKRNTTNTANATVYGSTSGAGAGSSTVTRKVTADIDTGFSFGGEVFRKGASTTILVKVVSVTGSGTIDFYWSEK